MKNVIKIMLSFFFASIFFYSHNLALAQEIKPTWEVDCKKLKSMHLTNPRVNIKFSKTPGIDEINTVWILKWADIDILVPKTKVTDVFVSKGHASAFDLLLVTNDGIKILAGVLPDKSTDDIFKRLDVENNTIESPLDSRSLTHEIYGGPVRISQISLFGFTVTPENLFCQDNSYIEEAGISVALILKNIESSGKLLSVYKNIGAYNGWIEKQRFKNHFEYTLNIIPDSGKELLCQVSYIIPDGSAHKDLPFWVGAIDKHKIKKNPEWLDALNLALQNKTENNWKEYAAIALKNGISDKSIAQTLKNLNIN